MSWFSSWLPALPSINYLTVPSSIQRRFISFVLKRSLGHLLKPGQLDIQQIDSQIGAGYVQVNDLELDSQAINDVITTSGLPLELVDGSIASVTARIPWPNPLTSTLGFSLSSLHLTLRVIPIDKTSSSNNVNLSDSVASYAETFIHDELTTREEAILKESLRTDLTSSLVHEADDENIPGGLDPFMNLSEEEEMPDVDPDGVGLFATLIERLLAKFEFDATGTKLTIIDPLSSSITISITDISYRTESKASTVESKDSSERDGESRTISVSGVTMSARDLQPVVPETPSSSSVLQTPSLSRRHRSPSLTPRSPSPSSSSSSDEEAQWAMSQSLAFLPPRAVSPARSVASSMYQSAISAQETIDEEPSPRVDTLPPVSSGSSEPTSHLGHVDETQDEIFFSFGTDPVRVKLTTPSVHGRASAQTSSEKLHISVDAGLISLAIRAWHIRSLARLADVLMSAHSPQPSPGSSADTQPNPGAGKQLSVNVKAVTLLLFASSITPSASRPGIDRFFSRPRIPPSLPEGYVRLLLDNISVMASMTTVGSASKPRPESSAARSTQISTLTFSLSLHEISVFASCAVAEGADAELLAFPLMITDPLLKTQYSAEHVHPSVSSQKAEFPTLPEFDIMDWTDEALHTHGMKLSPWRTKPKQGRTGHSRGHVSSHEASREEYIAPTPALSVKGERQTQETPSHKTKVLKDSIEVELAPLQFFIDLRHVLGDDGIQVYLNEIQSALRSFQEDEKAGHTGTDSDVEEEDDTPPATPRIGPRYRDAATEREQERQRLERLVLRDLDLDLDYREQVPHNETKPAITKKSGRRPVTKAGPDIAVTFPVIRAHVRCSPEHGRFSRSGAVVLDVHDLTLRKGQSPEFSGKTASFGSHRTAQPSSASNRDVLVTTELRRVVISASPAGNSQAFAVVSIGHLQEDTFGEGELHSPPERNAQPLLPRIVVAQTIKESCSTTTLEMFLPSVFVSMTKESLDSLQYWADDASQMMSQKPSSDYADSETNTEKAPSRDASLIGSRYFAKSRSGSGNTSVVSDPREVKTDIAVKVLVAEAFCRVSLPRGREQPAVVRPIDIVASDIDVSILVKPEGKDETVASVGLMNLVVNNHTSQESYDTLVSLIRARDLLATPTALLKLRFTSLVVPETMAKESRIRLSLWGFTYNFFPDISWISDLATFASAPPGAFESVVPSERTKIVLKVTDGSVKVLAPSHPGALLFHIGDLDFSTELVGESPRLSFMLQIHSAALLAIDDLSESLTGKSSAEGFVFWKKRGFALLAEITELVLSFDALKSVTNSDTKVLIERLRLRLHLCADTMAAITVFIGDLVSAFQPPLEQQAPKPKRRPMVISEEQQYSRGIMSSVDELAFKKVPEVGPAPDMIYDDLPRNLDYLDESFGAAGGLRELRDDDLDDFDDDEEVFPISQSGDDVVSRVGGETIRMLVPSLNVVSNHFNSLQPVPENTPTEAGETALQVHVHHTDINVFLYDGYDWASTRKTIENEVKEMRKRLAKIRQLVAKGQTQQSSGEETSALLFNSVYIGLDQDADELEPGALIAAIDEELKEDVEDMATESSWQTLPALPSSKRSAPSTRLNGRRLSRAKGPSIEIRVSELDADVSQYLPHEQLVSRVFATVKDLEILDHIKTSTWKKFLTALRSDSRGNTRETDSHMVKVELRTLRPVPEYPSEEARLKAKILPLRLHVDQDALDFLKKFFSFKDPNSAPSAPSDPDDGIYFQLAEIFPVDLKLDYKPRRVDYRALKEGKTIELMNFFHFDGAEMTLRHITLSGITGWPRLGELLNDLWTPDVKATQLVDVISGVAPIRSVVNVGSGIADLVLLPIAQYKKDGRIVRGVQKGTTAFVKSTAIEAIKLGAKLATGTQVILEQAEGVLGTQFKYPVTAEALQPPGMADDLLDFVGGSDDEENPSDLISRYADQPTNVKEGVQSAYKSLQRNLNSAAQTILAVPMEVYERSGNEGPVRSVIRAVPIAVLKPMIGASEAVSKTLLGLHNTLDPNLRHENEAKYKHR